MFRPYRMRLVVQGSCSVFHDDALKFKGTQDVVMSVLLAATLAVLFLMRVW